MSLSRPPRVVAPLILLLAAGLSCSEPPPTGPDETSNQAPAVTISSPSSGTEVTEGTGLTLTGTVTDDHDANLAASIQWSSSLDGELGTGGSVTVTLSAGTHTITAHVQDSGGLSDQSSVTVTVNAPPVVTIVAPGADTTVQEGSAVTLTGEASDAEDGDLSAAIAWSSDVDGALGGGPAASVTVTLSVGTHEIVATVTDAGGATAADTTTVTVEPNTAPVVEVTAPAADTTVDEGGDVTLTAQADDAQEGDLSAAIAWTSDLDGALGAGPAASVTVTLSVGVHEIVATVQDQLGATGADTVVVTVDARPSVAILAPNDTTVLSGSSLDFAASAADAEDGDVSAAIAWSSDVDGDLGTGAAVSATLSAGAHRVVARVVDGRGQAAADTVDVDVVDATAIELGDLLARSLATADEEDVYVFDGTAGDRVLIAIQESSGFGGGARFPQATVFGPDGSVLDGPFNGDQARLTLGATGVHQIRVTSGNAADLLNTGTYALGLEGIGPLSPDAMAIGLGDLVDGTVGAVAETDLLVFDASDGDDVFLTVLGSLAGQPALGTLFSPSGQDLGDFANTRAQLSLSETGTYALSLRAGNLSAQGGYTVGLEGLDPPSPDTIRLDLGDLRTSTLSDAGAVDLFVFDGSADDDVLLAVREASGFVGTDAPEATVFGPDGQIVVGAFGNVQTRLSLPDDGRYLVRVRGSVASATGTYAIGLEGLGPLSPDTVRIGLGGLANGTVSAVAETDLLVFDAASGDEVLLTVLGNLNVAGQRAQGTLFSPTGQDLGDFVNERRQMTLNETGTYAMRIRAGNLSAQGGYTVGLEGLDPLSPDTVRLELSDLRTSNLPQAGAVDLFVFDGDADDDVLLAVRESGGFVGTDAPEATVFGPAGQVVAAGLANEQSRITLPSSGRYTVRVQGNDVFASGTYAIGLDGLSPLGPDTVRIGLGDLVTGTVGAVADVDMYVFDAASGDEIFLTVLGNFSPAGQRAQGTLFSPTGQDLGNLVNARQQMTLNETGTYALMLRAGNLSAQGGYTVGLEGLDPLSPDTVRLDPGDVRTSAISQAGALDLFVFDGTEDDEVLLAVRATSGFVGVDVPQATVFGPAGQVVAGGFGDDQVQFSLPSTGLYTVRVQGSAAFATGTYAIGFESVVPPSPDATGLTVGGGATAGSIGAAAETDLFTFDGTSGASVDVTLTGFAGVTATVYTPAGAAILTLGPGTQTIGSLPATGQYVVSVAAANLVNTGNYSIELQ